MPKSPVSGHFWTPLFWWEMGSECGFIFRNSCGVSLKGRILDLVDKCYAMSDRGCPNPAVGYRKPAMGFYSGSNLQDIQFTGYPLNSEGEIYCMTSRLFPFFSPYIIQNLHPAHERSHSWHWFFFARERSASTPSAPDSAGQCKKSRRAEDEAILTRHLLFVGLAACLLTFA